MVVKIVTWINLIFAIFKMCIFAIFLWPTTREMFSHASDTFWTNFSNTFTLRGIGRPGAALAIFADGFEAGDVAVMADGKWQKSITLPDGMYEILVKEQGADNTASPALALQVDSDLVWNPNAFSVEISGVEAGTFTNFPYGTNGRIDPTDWQLGVILPP